MLSLSGAISQAIAANPGAGGNDLDPVLSGIAATLDADIQVLDTPRGFLAFQVQTAAGSLVGRSGDGPSDIGGDVQSLGLFDATTDGQRYRVHRHWSEDRKYLIQVTQSQASRQKIFDSVMLSRDGLLTPLLVGFPLLLLPVLFGVYTGLAPLRSISRELGSREPSDLRPLQAPHVYSELAPVVRELNATMARLAGLLQRERDFLAAAAH